MSALFDPVKAASAMSDTVLVSFSGGKDSVVVLDLCCRYFKTVKAFFMYQVAGLSFQESMIRYAENRYGIEVLRLPHFELSEFLAFGTHRKHDLSVPVVSIADVYRYARLSTGAYWIAAGERIADSIVRRAMMKRSGCIDEKRGRFFPIANWTKADIVRYIERKRLKVAPEAAVIGHSFRSLRPSELAGLKSAYPEDFEKVARWFPFAEAAVMKHRLSNEAN